MSEAIKVHNNELDLSKIVDQDILDTFKNTSVFYGDIISAQLIHTMQDLLMEMRKHSEFPPKKRDYTYTYTFADPRGRFSEEEGE